MSEEKIAVTFILEKTLIDKLNRLSKKSLITLEELIVKILEEYVKKMKIKKTIKI